MARLMFGGGIADWTFTLDTETGAAKPAGGVQLTFYDAQSGGNRLSDLQSMNGAAISAVTTSAGNDGMALGQVPAFFGPDDVYEMWAEASGGPRALMTAANLGSYLGPVREQLEAHVSGGSLNPHSTTLAALTDVDADTKSTGQVLAVASDGTWKPTTVAGVGGTVTFSGDETISGKKTFENQGSPGTVRLGINAAEGQTMDVFQVWSSANAGQAGAKAKTAWFNNKGEARFAPARSDSVGVQITAQPGQAANVFEQLSSAGTAVSRMEPNGAWRAPNLGRSIMFSKSGNLVTGAGTFVWTNDTGVPLTIRSARITAGTAPAGSAVIVDVNVSGTTIFGTQANRPTIAAGGTTSGKVTGFSTAVIPNGGTITVDVDQVGSSTPGADLTAQIDVY